MPPVALSDAIWCRQSADLLNSFPLNNSETESLGLGQRVQAHSRGKTRNELPGSYPVICDASLAGLRVALLAD